MTEVYSTTRCGSRILYNTEQSSYSVALVVQQHRSSVRLSGTTYSGSKICHCQKAKELS